MIAHQGGWDELLIAAAAILLLLLLRSARNRRAAEPASGPCLYCGRPLVEDVSRCPGCGFRARRGTWSGTPPKAAAVTESPTGGGR